MLPGATPTKGRLLVATPPLEDPNFDRTVVFMLEHHDEGAVGVILNRPSDLPLHEPIDRWNDIEASPSGLYSGGPVELDALIALGYAAHEPTEESESVSPLAGPVVSVDLSCDPALAAGEVSKIRVFRGYSGWSSRQLETELNSGAWMVVDAEPDDIFSDDPSDLWRSVLRRQPGRVSWLANAPDDLHLN